MGQEKQIMMFVQNRTKLH